MLAIPVATTSRSVWESSQEECTSAFRPRLSGIHSAPYPHSSTRLAKAAACAALMPSIPTQTPSLPSSIAERSFTAAAASVKRHTGFVQSARGIPLSTLAEEAEHIGKLPRSGTRRPQHQTGDAYSVERPRPGAWNRRNLHHGGQRLTN